MAKTEVSIYLHSSKESVVDSLIKQGVPEDTAQEWRYLGCEHKVTYSLDLNDINGRADVITVDDKPLIPSEKGEISDGYHTFNELYEHRHALFMNLMGFCDSWKSTLHADGTMFSDGWFIAGLSLPNSKKPITYHLPIKYWNICPGRCLERAPEWDGHTSADVVSRLLDEIPVQPDKLAPTDAHPEGCGCRVCFDSEYHGDFNNA